MYPRILYFVGLFEYHENLHVRQNIIYKVTLTQIRKRHNRSEIHHSILDAVTHEGPPLDRLRNNDSLQGKIVSIAQYPNGGTTVFLLASHNELQAA